MKFAVNRYRQIAFALITMLLLSAALFIDFSNHAKAAPAAIETPAGRLCQAGINAALKGDMEKAVDKIDLAYKADPKSPLIKRAKTIISDYVRTSKNIAAQRKQDFNYEKKRIESAQIAQRYAAALEKISWGKKFRKNLSESMTKAFNNIGTAYNFNDCDEKLATKMKKTSLQNIDKMVALIDDSLKLTKAEDTPYVDRFREEAKSAKAQLAVVRKVWENVDPSTEISRWKGSIKILDTQHDLTNVIADLNVLVTKNPWKMVLFHASNAKDIAPDSVNVKAQPWFKSILKNAHQRGQTAIKNAKWFDALAIYLSLTELDKSSAEFRAQMKKSRKHVRVLGLYTTRLPEGVKRDKNASKKADYVKQVNGVKSETAMRAISYISSGYVKPVDFAELIEGGLDSMEVLVTTPQASESFPVLKNKDKLQKMLKFLKAIRKSVRKEDRVNATTLKTVMRRVMDFNENSLGLPEEVVVMEFSNGFMSELDRFSTLVWPYDLAEFRKAIMGNFVGIGVQIDKKTGEYLRVMMPIPGTPAFKAGLKAGDFIMSVDGASTKNETVDRIIKRITGKAGTKTKLKIKRRGIEKPFFVKVTRASVQVKTVKGWKRTQNGSWEFMLDPKKKIGYIRLTQFTDKSYKDIFAALKSLKEAGCKSLVLDLRSNPGGLLRIASSIANEFIRGGRIVMTRGRLSPKTELEANSRGLFQKGDLVVLIDENSASASEILSGALKDWKRALIVGTRSYGKGSVQNLLPIQGRQQALIKLTTAYYYLPSGRLLHRNPDSTDWGVNPHVKVSLTPRQMRKWLQIRRKTDLLKEVDPRILRDDLKMQLAADHQLSTALVMLDLMRLKRELATETADK